MAGCSGQQVERMRKQRQDCAERAFGTFGTSRKVNDQGASNDAASAASESGERGVARSVLADEFGQAGNQTVADVQRGFGCDIAGCKAGSTGGDDQRGCVCGFAQGGGDLIALVGNNMDCENLGGCFGEQALDGWAGEISLRSGEATVADG